MAKRFLDLMNVVAVEGIYGYDDLVEGYLAFIELTSKPKTIGQYRSTYRAIKEHLEAIQAVLKAEIGVEYNFIDDFSSIDKKLAKVIQAYFYDELGEETVTANNKLGALSRLYDFMLDTNDEDSMTNPFKLLKKAKECTEQRYIPSKKEVNAVIRHLRSNTYEVAQLKHLTAIVLLYDSCSRVNEVLSLKWEDLNLANPDAMTVTFKDTKNGRVYTKPLSSKLVYNLLMKVKQYQLPIDRGYIFTTSSGKLIHRNQLRTVLKKATDKLGITSGMDLHSFRRARATHLINDGADYYFVSSVMLAHSSIATTEKSYLKPNQSKANQNIRSFKVF